MCGLTRPCTPKTPGFRHPQWSLIQPPQRGCTDVQTVRKGNFTGEYTGMKQKRRGRSVLPDVRSCLQQQPWRSPANPPDSGGLNGDGLHPIQWLLVVNKSGGGVRGSIFKLASSELVSNTSWSRPCNILPGDTAAGPYPGVRPRTLQHRSPNHEQIRPRLQVIREQGMASKGRQEREFPARRQQAHCRAESACRRISRKAQPPEEAQGSAAEPAQPRAHCSACPPAEPRLQTFRNGFAICEASQSAGPNC